MAHQYPTPVCMYKEPKVSLTNCPWLVSKVVHHRGGHATAFSINQDNINLQISIALTAH